MPSCKLVGAETKQEAFLHLSIWLMFNLGSIELENALQFRIKMEFCVKSVANRQSKEPSYKLGSAGICFMSVTNRLLNAPRCKR